VLSEEYAEEGTVVTAMLDHATLGQVTKMLDRN